MTPALGLCFTALHADLILDKAGLIALDYQGHPRDLWQANQDLIAMGFVAAENGIPTDLCFAVAMAIRSYARREVALATGAATSIKPRKETADAGASE